MLFGGLVLYVFKNYPKKSVRKNHSFFATSSRKVGEVHNLRCEGSFYYFLLQGLHPVGTYQKIVKKT